MERGLQIKGGRPRLLSALPPGGSWPSSPQPSVASPAASRQRSLSNRLLPSGCPLDERRRRAALLSQGACGRLGRARLGRERRKGMDNLRCLRWETPSSMRPISVDQC